MEHTILKAQIERDKRLALSQTMRGEALCDRMVAEATTSKTCENASIDALSATAKADTDIVLAENFDQRILPFYNLFIDK